MGSVSEKNHFLVGISIDGPKSMHDKFRIHALGAGTYDQVIRSIALLNSYSIPFNVLSVLSSELSKHPEE